MTYPMTGVWQDYDTYKIVENTTLYVTLSGSDATGNGTSDYPWATPHHALNYLKDKWINSDVTVTIKAGDGTFTFSEALQPTHPCGDRIELSGTNTYTKTMSSVQSSSGSEGAYSVIINLDSVTNISIGDYCIIHTSSGGTYPERILGCHEITNVDVDNSRITIMSNNLVGAPSGNVVATVIIFKTMFVGSGCSVLYVTYGNRLNNINKCVFVGDASYRVIDLDGGLTLNDGSFGVSSNGLSCVLITNTGSLIFKGTTGVFAFSGALTSWNAGIVSYGGTVLHDFIYSSILIISGNFVNVYPALGCRMAIYNATTKITGGTYGLSAWNYGYIRYTGTCTGNTTNFSPSVNTQGNEYGYIDT
jgi:hypothetical protein